MNLKNQLSGAPGQSSADSVEEFDSRKDKFNKQIGVKELQALKEEVSSGHTASEPATTKAKDVPELEFKKPGDSTAEGQKELHRVTSYNIIAPLNEEHGSEEENE